MRARRYDERSVPRRRNHHARRDVRTSESPVRNRVTDLCLVERNRGDRRDRRAVAQSHPLPNLCPPQGGTMTATTRPPTRELFDRYADTYATHDVDAIVALHSVDTQFWLHLDQAPARGRAAVAETFAGFFAQWP